MDKLTVMSCLLFFMADAFAIVAISMPDWIVTNVGGNFIAHYDVTNCLPMLKSRFYVPRLKHFWLKAINPFSLWVSSFKIHRRLTPESHNNNLISLSFFGQSLQLTVHFLL